MADWVERRGPSAYTGPRRRLDKKQQESDRGGRSEGPLGRAAGQIVGSRIFGKRAIRGIWHGGVDMLGPVVHGNRAAELREAGW